MPESPLSLPDQYLLRTILKRVSRSFYLTLAILPKPVRNQVGLAYLLARAADTIADTGQLEDTIRIQCLHKMKTQFLQDKVNWDDIREIQALVGSHQQNPAEEALLRELEHCFILYQKLRLEDQARLGRLLPIIIEGMEFDLTQFPDKATEEVTALACMEDLDYYTYAVAGCVGDFWTHMMCSHLRGLAQWDRNVMAPVGIRYGKGLQLVNILRDLPQDLRRGRCYVPIALLKEVGMSPKDLLDKQNAPIFQPVLRRLVHMALEHLDQGWRYTLAIPRSEIRLRLACMWPILIGVRTLQGLLASPNLLDPSAPVKTSRGEVYRMMALTTLSGGCGYVGTAYWGHIRKKIV